MQLAPPCLHPHVKSLQTPLQQFPEQQSPLAPQLAPEALHGPHTPSLRQMSVPLQQTPLQQSFAVSLQQTPPQQMLEQQTSFLEQVVPGPTQQTPESQMVPGQQSLVCLQDAKRPAHCWQVPFWQVLPLLQVPPLGTQPAGSQHEPLLQQASPEPCGQQVWPEAQQAAM